MNNEKVPTKYSAEAKITRDKEKIQNEENLTIFMLCYTLPSKNIKNP